MIRSLWTLLLLALSVQGMAQSEDGSSPVPQSTSPPRRTTFAAGLGGHFGYLIPHSADLRTLPTYYPWGIEADFGWQFVTEGAYKFCSCYPRVGFTTTYMRFDDRQVLGNAYIAAIYVEPVFFQPRKFNLSFRLGVLGIAGLDTPYDEVTNPRNSSYSLPIAFPLIVGVGFNYRPTAHLNIRLQGQMNHLSNGGLQLPNKGLNYVTAVLSAEYTFHPADLPNRGKMRREPPENKNRFEIDIGNSAKNSSPQDPVHHWILSLSTQYSRWIVRSLALGGGVNLELDRSRKEGIRNSEDPTRSFERFSVYAGYELWLGRVRFSQMAGVYLYDDFRVDAPWYHRTELNVHAFPWLFFGVGLKAHYAVADYLDIKVGYSFSWKNGASLRPKKGKQEI
jgi:hypothetical protein